MDVAALVTTAAALGDKTRFQLLLALSDGSRSIAQLADVLNVTSSTITHHVARLEDAGLVVVVRRGRQSIVRQEGRRWAAVVAAFST